jgi:chromosome segregation ATPase
MMTSKRPLLVAGLSILLFACAGDPNKQASDAHDAELESRREARQDEAEERSETRIRAAEAQREQTEANATGSPASQDRASADAKLTEARATYRAEATERLEKLDARITELKANVARAGGKATTSSRDALNTADSQRSLVARHLAEIPRVASDNWDRAKTNIDQQLDTLEGFVKKAADEVDAFKR